MFSMSYNIVYNVLCFPSPAPGQVLLGFHQNCCCSSTARVERHSSSGTCIAGVLQCSALFAAMAAQNEVSLYYCDWHCRWSGSQMDSNIMGATSYADELKVLAWNNKDSPLQCDLK